MKNERRLHSFLCSAMLAFCALPAWGQLAKVVVAPTGGDYTTLSAAMAAYTPNPILGVLLVEVMPGIYTENVVMKSYVYVRGTLATIRGQTTKAPVVSIHNAAEVTLEGLTISGSPLPAGFPGYGSIAIDINNSGSVALNRISAGGTNTAVQIIAGNYVTLENSYLSGADYGLTEGNGTRVIIRNNRIDATRIGLIPRSASTTVYGNVVAAATASAQQGIQAQGGLVSANHVRDFRGGGGSGINVSQQSVVIGNYITNSYYGLRVQSASAVVQGNVATDNYFADVNVVGLPSDNHVSGMLAANVFNTTRFEPGAVLKGGFNVTQSGDLIPAPVFYEVAASTTTEQQVQTIQHRYCALSQVRSQATDASRNRWCRLDRNADGTWLLKARSGNGPTTTCRASCL
jgi:Right handed beta helix region